jgi:hypothetical protein
MDEEKMQRQMEFIVEQQAQFAAKIGQLEDTTRQIGGLVERLSGVVERLVDAVARRFEAMDRRDEETDRKFAALADAQIRTEDRLAEIDLRAAERHAETDRRAAERAAEFDRKFAMLTESQQKTEESIRNLTEVVNRHIADGHGGGARPEG